MNLRTGTARALYTKYFPAGIQRQTVTGLCSIEVQTTIHLSSHTIPLFSRTNFTLVNSQGHRRVPKKGTWYETTGRLRACSGGKNRAADPRGRVRPGDSAAESRAPKDHVSHGQSSV